MAPWLVTPLTSGWQHCTAAVGLAGRFRRFHSFLPTVVTELGLGRCQTDLALCVLLFWTER